MCKHWLAAREKAGDLILPKDYGCPLGQFCEYAHGIEELRGDDREETTKKFQVKKLLV